MPINDIGGIMQKVLLAQFNSFKKWFFITFFLISSNPILTDLIIYISPNRIVKYAMFFISIVLSSYCIYKLYKNYRSLADIIKR